MRFLLRRSRAVHDFVQGRGGGGRSGGLRVRRFGSHQPHQPHQPYLPYLPYLP